MDNSKEFEELMKRCLSQEEAIQRNAVRLAQMEQARQRGPMLFQRRRSPSEEIAALEPKEWDGKLEDKADF